MRGSSAFFPAVTAGACAVAAMISSQAYGQCSPHPGNNGTSCCQQVGPDVIVGDIQSSQNYTAEQIPAASGNYVDAFSFGTTSCNIGNANVLWDDFPQNGHPCIGQNLFKIKNGRIEQLGQSWLKHGFTALTQNACGCTCSGQGGGVLGVGCSDPYTAARNGTQGGAGPKWQVNAATGFFPTGSPANPSFSGQVARRLQVKSTDLEVSSGSVLYFAECQYVTQDDAAAGNKYNNASYRKVSITGGPNEWSAAVIDSTQREQPGIRAWKDVDPTVTETDLDVPNDGRFILSAKATDNGDGTWHYEYALQNLNSDYSGQGFNVPLLNAPVITNIGFHDVPYHDFDGIPGPDGPDPDTLPDPRNYDGTDWPSVISGASISWATTPYGTDSNANAIRWGTMYNFRFDCNRAPVAGQVTLNTFKVAGSYNINTVVPGPGSAPLCPPDIAPLPSGDGQVNIDDLLGVINSWGATSGPADINHDNIVNIDDLLAVINSWGACPT